MLFKKKETTKIPSTTTPRMDLPEIALEPHYLCAKPFKVPESRFSKYTIDDVPELYNKKPLSQYTIDYINRDVQTPEQMAHGIIYEILQNTVLNGGCKLKNFTREFEEYVVLEIRTKNRMKLIPRWNLPCRFFGYCKLVWIRCDCFFTLDTQHYTPRHHAKYFRKFVNDELIRMDLYFTVPLYYNKKRDPKHFIKDVYKQASEEERARWKEHGRQIMDGNANADRVGRQVEVKL